MINSNSDSPRLSKINRSDFNTVIDGKSTDLFYLHNKNGVELTVTNFGARVVEFWCPDKNGSYDDIVLGHDTIEKYINYQGERFLGSVIGRFANRLAFGKFTLDNVQYNLPLNNGSNCLHGGTKGFDMVVWDAYQVSSNKLNFKYISKDGEQGFPGELRVRMCYELTENNEFVITYRTTTDKRTVVNLTHHSFFNLHGAGNGTINDHELMLNADRFTAVDSELIPTGEIVYVDNTPMDFQEPTPIGLYLNDGYTQLQFGKGYDHNWVLKTGKGNDPKLAATVYESKTGRFLEVYTTQPCIQFYGGNFFDGSTVGKGGKSYNYRTAFALETQHFPDSPNQPDFPSSILSPDEEYRHICIYKINVRK